MQKCLRGFSEIKRYWDKTNDIFAAKILPGEYYVTANNEAITTVLGSCVSACIRDTVFRIGGMNHFMLPLGKEMNHTEQSLMSNAARYGNFAMEKMINDILKNGGTRENLEVKIFGGGLVLQNMKSLDIGRGNIDFVREYIALEELRLVGEDVGDVFPRKVIYFPLTGRVKVKKLRQMHNRTIIEREDDYMSSLDKPADTPDIELF
ncbi:MAG: chemoreceptor glutamine deamidase CheD [Woeseiaceae bacterium]